MYAVSPHKEVKTGSAEQRKNARAAAPPLKQFLGDASALGLENAADMAAQWVFANDVSGATARPKLGFAPASRFGLQRKCACGGTCDSCQTNDENLMVQRSPSTDGSATAESTIASPVEDNQQAEPLGVIVEDGQPVGPGQTTHAAFMSALRAQLFAVCNEELAAVGRSAEGCPYLNQWLGYYENRSASQVERAIRLYAQTNEREPQALITAIASRARAAVRIWTTTGMVTGIPEVGSLLGSAQMGGTAGSLGGGSSTAASSAGAVQAKSRDGGAPSAAVNSLNPTSIRSQLSGGSSLESGIRSRMERGFGRSFAGVRVHTNETATRLAQGLSARAFTVGHDIAFSAGEYRPGTVGGDLLIAHELAHTVQQGAAEGDYVQPMGGEGWLEDDADMAAVGAVGSELGLTERREPERQSGLRLQGCQTVKKRCPHGYSWRVISTVGFGSAGCDCIWTCRPGGPPDPPSSGPTVRCPPEMNCSTGVRYEDVSSEYRHHGYGAAFTPLGEQGACGCFPLNIDGEQISDSPLEPTSIEMTDLAAPTADMAAAAMARHRARTGGGTAGAPKPITDPRTGTVIPPHEGSPPSPNRPNISPPPEHVAPAPPQTRPPVPGELPAPRGPATGGAPTSSPPSETPTVPPPHAGAAPPTEDVTPPRGTRVPQAGTAPARQASIVNSSNSSRYAVSDSTNPRFQVFATVEGGEIVMTMRTVMDDGQRSAVLNGAEQFGRIVNHFSGQFTGIRGSWSYGDNLARFNELTGQGATPEAAAARTWTGERAAEHGYTQVTLRRDRLEGSPGAYTKVVVVFTRP